MDLLDAMATYVRVVEAGSFAGAAKQLKVTSGAVSRQVAALESELRVTLLARSTRSMSLTADGHRYHERCLRVLREVAAAQAIGAERGVEGILRVGAPVSFGLAGLMPHITTLRVKYPALRVEVHLEDRLLDTVLDGLDVVLRAGTSIPLTTGIVARRLTAFPFVLVAAPSYLEHHDRPTSPEALASHDILTCHVAAGPDVWTLENGEREACVTLTDSVVFRCHVLQGVRDLALAGQGIALLPDWLVRGDLEQELLRPVLPGWRTEAIPVSAIHRRTERDAPRVRAFVEHLAEALAPPLASTPRRQRRAS